MSAEITALLNDLEIRLGVNLPQTWQPEYDEDLCEDGLDVDLFYAGSIIAHADGSDGPGWTIGEINDEGDAQLICAAINALPRLITYIRELESKDGGDE